MAVVAVVVVVVSAVVVVPVVIAVFTAVVVFGFPFTVWLVACGGIVVFPPPPAFRFRLSFCIARLAGRMDRSYLLSAGQDIENS